MEDKSTRTDDIVFTAASPSEGHHSDQQRGIVCAVCLVWRLDFCMIWEASAAATWAVIALACFACDVRVYTSVSGWNGFESIRSVYRDAGFTLLYTQLVCACVHIGLQLILRHALSSLPDVETVLFCSTAEHADDMSHIRTRGCDD